LAGARLKGALRGGWQCESHATGINAGKSARYFSQSVKFLYTYILL